MGTRRFSTPRPSNADWLPGTVAALYGTRDPETVAVKENLEALLGPDVRAARLSPPVPSVPAGRGEDLHGVAGVRVDDAVAVCRAADVGHRAGDGSVADPVGLHGVNGAGTNSTWPEPGNLDIFIPIMLYSGQTDNLPLEAVSFNY